MKDLPDDPIHKSITVPLDRHAAFDLFTHGIDRWWPTATPSAPVRDGRAERATIRVEPREGGRVLETGADGTERPWATVRTWQPGRRLDLRWTRHDEDDDAIGTDVTITFTQTEAGTRVDLTHSGFAGLAPVAALLPSAAAAFARHDALWKQILRHFVDRCALVDA